MPEWLIVLVWAERLLWTAIGLALLGGAWDLDRSARRDGAALYLAADYDPRGARVLIVALFRTLAGVIGWLAGVLTLVGGLALLAPLPDAATALRSAGSGALVLVGEAALLGGVVRAARLRAAIDRRLRSRRS